MSPLFRLARAAAFAVVSLGLGVAAHVLGGGSVSAPVMLGALGLSFGAAVPLAGRERTFALILPLLGALQVVMHLLFALAHTAPEQAAAGHAHAGLVPGLGMLVAHGWAIALTALWLSRGEAALFAVLRRLAVRLLVIVLPLFSTPFSVPPSTSRPLLPRSAVLRHVVSRRGPPEVVPA
ncbi:MFS transporter [Nonomuraea sp. NN258]|uniref:MFS transporter n=1 Tax=Nonomuraea antri TaxID=2730852 RepID=UPI001568B628|nr:MFS transporter [Nonomuraea antri]NRQ31621.1 MFS transporter [Nonomuraea antri]